MAISFTPTKIARFVGALYGVALNNSTNTAAVTEIYARGFNAVANEVFAADFGTQTTAAVATTIATNLGLTGAALTDATAYLEGQLNAAAADARGAVVINALNLFAGLTTDATYGAAATAFEARVASAIAYSNAASSVHHGAFGDLATTITYELTTGFDKLTGTSSADSFMAYSINNVNTLQDGDVLNGGAGTDTLFADITSGTLSGGAITPRTTSIEQATFRVQHNQTDSGDNNIAGVGIIDAERMSGTNIYEDKGSRATLVIEDVRIGASQKTKDITVIMRDTDPGDVDFGLYFDQNSLRNVSNSSSTVNLRVLDTHAKNQGLAELKDSPYGSFTFWYSADAGATYTKVELASQAMQDAQSITDMVTAMQAQADAVFGAGVVTVSKGIAYSVPDSVSGNTVSSNEITMSTNAAIMFDTTVNPGSGWKATDTVPAVSGLYTSYNTNTASATDLVTSTVILDNVGRGSMGGDLVIGGLSVGSTSTSKGVQQFDITVEDNSKLQNINSTNNTLQVVNIVNGTGDELVDDAYVTSPNDGNLTVTGTSLSSVGNELPGDNSQDDTYGFNDVRVINAATMTGKLTFDAMFGSTAIAKYVNLVDTGALPSTDNIAVDYDGGTNNDTMDVSISGVATASASNIVSGREDFTFTIDGNAGNDTITVRVENEAGGVADWYYNQNLNDNIAIGGGAGDDTIWTPGAGDINIDAGAGADTVYTDNTGAQAAGALSIDVVDKGAWLFNTAAQTSAVADAAAFRDLDDLRSDVNDSYNLYKATLQVTFKGIPSATITLANSSTYKTTDLEINQAIKNAINNDATLAKLIVAQDGPANSLIVKSLIDGVMSTADLVVTITAPASPAADLSTTELAAANAAWGTSYANSAAALAAEATVVTTLTTKADYVDVLATDGTTTERTGAASTTSSDNFITPGTGNDVIVLGTTVGLGSATSSNEVVKYTAADFGNDVIVNFAVSGAGQDFLDFSTLGVKSTGAISNLVTGGGLTAALALSTNGSVWVEDLVTTDGTATDNDSAADVKELFTDTANASTFKGIYVAVSSHNVGTVYQITDGTTTSDITVTSLGSIDLADTAWSTLTSISTFVAPTVYAYGPSASTGVLLAATNGGGAQTLTGGAFDDILNGSAAQTAGDTLTINGNAGNDTITGGGLVDAITGGAGNDTINPGEGADTVTGGAGTDSITLTDTDNAADIVIITSALAADADTVAGFGAGEDDLQIDISDLGLNAGDYAAAAAAAVTGAAGNALAAGAASNNIVVDTWANIQLMVDADSAWVGAAIAYATDTGVLYYDADADFSAGSVAIATLTGAPAIVAATDAAFIA